MSIFRVGESQEIERKEAHSKTELHESGFATNLVRSTSSVLRWHARRT